MPTEPRTGSSGRPSPGSRRTGEKVVELEKGPDGTYEPKREVARRPAPKPPQSRQVVHVRVTRKSDFDQAVEEVIFGFRKGMSIAKKVAKAFDVKL